MKEKIKMQESSWILDLITTAKIPFPNNITFSGTGGWDSDIPF